MQVGWSELKNPNPDTSPNPWNQSISHSCPIRVVPGQFAFEESLLKPDPYHEDRTGRHAASKTA